MKALVGIFSSACLLGSLVSGCGSGAGTMSPEEQARSLCPPLTRQFVGPNFDARMTALRSVIEDYNPTETQLLNFAVLACNNLTACINCNVAVVDLLYQQPQEMAKEEVLADEEP